MFGKLKDKLKSALSIFSKKAEEEAEVKVVETIKEVVPEVKAVEIKKEETKTEPKKKEEPKKISEKKAEKKPEIKKRDDERKTVPEKTREEKVLIFHGWEDNAGSGFIPALKDYLHKNNIRAFSFDQPNASQPKFEEWFAFAERKIAEANTDNLNIVGHSMGGLLALKLAEKYKIRKLILVAPVGSSPSEDYFKEIGKRLSPEELEIFRKYQNRALDLTKIKNNVGEIAFVFGLKDEWITEEIRNFYVNSFHDVAEIHLFEEFGHMSESEGVKHLPLLEELFGRNIKPGATEHKKAVEEKKSFFGKIKDTFRKKEEAPAEVIPEKIPELKPIELTEKQTEPEKETEKPAESTFFGKLKQAITTKTISAERFAELFWDLEVVLLENNVSVEVIERIKKDLEKELVDKPLPRDVESKILDTLKRTLLNILTFTEINLIEKTNHKKPLVIAFFGINGTGKTTTIAKLTAYFHQHHKSVVLAAGDTFRAAAIQQLEEHAQRLCVKIIKHDYGADAAAVAFDAIRYAQSNGIDVVLIDTAGRLHSNINLMAELEKIIRVAKPDLKIFVGESITGNDCIEQARQFNQLVEMDGAILTKADVDEKGGAPLSVAYTIKKPILFLGIGQKYEDLEPFDARIMLQRLGL